MVCLRHYAGILVYDPVEDTWTVEDLPWNADLSGGINDACVHNGRLVVFTGRGARGIVDNRWAYERATDGSWSCSESEYGGGDHDGCAIVSGSAVLG